MTVALVFVAAADEFIRMQPDRRVGTTMAQPSRSAQYLFFQIFLWDPSIEITRL
jgi:hypothetical protein